MNGSDLEYLLAVLRCAIRKEAPPLPDDVSLSAVFHAAKRHGVFLLVFDALMNLDTVRAHPRFPDWEKYYLLRIAQAMNQTYELQHLDELLRTEHIPHVLLKGAHLRKLYPRPELREMCDIDILIPTDQEAQALDAVMRDGYTLQGDLTTSHNTELFKPPFQALELHTYLVPKESRYFFYYGAFWSHAIKGTDDYSYSFRLEDRYVYLIVHTEKHYALSGTGIRSVIDIFCFLQQYGNRMDRAYLQEAFDRLEIASFADDMEAIANHCFGDARVSLSEEQQKIEHRILSGAVYGTTEQKNSNTLERRMHDGKNVRTVKFRMFFEKIFPDRAFMSGWYPWVKKSSALLPAAWVARWCCLAVKKPQALRQHYRYVKELRLLQDEQDGKK